jgi:hypothetical protein
MTQGEDMTTAMAKALVDGLDVEGAEQIWRKINEANIKAMPVKKEDTVKPETPKAISEEKEETSDRDKVVFVDFVTYISKRKKKVEKVAVKANEIDEMAKEKQVDNVQLSLFG